MQIREREQATAGAPLSARRAGLRSRFAAVPRGTKVAALCMLAIELFALVYYVAIGRRLWFWLDEWEFLANRTAGSPSDLINEHGNVHPSTLPILAYRLMWNLVGIRSYVPYVAMIVVVHLACASVLWIIMQRLGVRPWLATALGALFVLLGNGYENILWGFQISFVGAVLFGFVHLLLADHDGRWNRRDWLGLGAGLLALLCSAVAVAMVLGVGVAMLLRRGWRVALAHTVPLELLYVTWWATVARSSYNEARRLDPTSPSDVANFVVRAVGHAFRVVGGRTDVAIALGAALILGLVLAWGRCRGRELCARASVPLGLGAAAVAFLGITGFGRANAGIDDPWTRPRYLYIVVALLLPLLAVAADALITRWRLLAPVVLVLVVAGIPGNVDVAHDYADQSARGFRQLRRAQLAVPQSPIAREVPRSLKPQTVPFFYYTTTVGWLLEGVESGRIPTPPRVRAEDAAMSEVRLSLDRYARPAPVAFARCEPVVTGSRIDLRLDVGQAVVVHGATAQLVPPEVAPESVFPLLLEAGTGSVLTTAIRPIEIRAVVLGVAADAEICAPGGAFTEANA